MVGSGGAIWEVDVGWVMDLSAIVGLIVVRLVSVSVGGGLLDVKLLLVLNDMMMIHE